MTVTTLGVLFVCVRNAGRAQMAAGQPLPVVRQVRDDIRDRVQAVLAELIDG